MWRGCIDTICGEGVLIRCVERMYCYDVWRGCTVTINGLSVSSPRSGNRNSNSNWSLVLPADEDMVVVPSNASMEPNG